MFRNALADRPHTSPGLQLSQEGTPSRRRVADVGLHFSKWKQALSDAGFRLIENPNQPEAGSRAYTNLWIVENRYEDHVQLFSPGGSYLPWPPTNMVLVAEKPR